MYKFILSLSHGVVNPEQVEGAACSRNAWRFVGARAWEGSCWASRLTARTARLGGLVHFKRGALEINGNADSVASPRVSHPQSRGITKAPTSVGAFVMLGIGGREASGRQRLGVAVYFKRSALEMDEPPQAACVVLLVAS